MRPDVLNARIEMRIARLRELAAFTFVQLACEYRKPRPY